MDWLSMLLVIGISVFMCFYTYKRGMPIYRYYKYEKENKLESVEGEIIDRLFSEYKKIGSKRMRISIPRVSYKYNEKECVVDGVCYYIDVVIGSKIDVSVYCEGGKQEAWITKDLPRMKEELRTRVIVMLVMILLLIVSAIIL